MPASQARASRSRTAPPPRSISTPAFARLSARSPSISALWYWYPGGQCFNGSPAPVFGTDCLANGYLPVNLNVVKADLSFWEVYAKATLTVTDQFAIGGAVYYSRRAEFGR